MPQEIKFGIFGTAKIIKSDEGLIRVKALVQESGLYAFLPPEELRIREILPWNITDEEAKQIVEDMNKQSDLPVYVKEVDIRVLR